MLRNFLFFIVWLYLVWNLVETSKMICPEQFTPPAKFCRAAARQPVSKRSLQYMPLNFQQTKRVFSFQKADKSLVHGSFIIASVEYRCSDLRWCCLQQTVHFFLSDPHTVIPTKLAFPSLHSSISHYTLKTLIS